MISIICFGVGMLISSMALLAFFDNREREINTVKAVGIPGLFLLASAVSHYIGLP